MNLIGYKKFTAKNGSRWLVLSVVQEFKQEVDSYGAYLDGFVINQNAFGNLIWIDLDRVDKGLIEVVGELKIGCAVKVYKEIVSGRDVICRVEYIAEKG